MYRQVDTGTWDDPWFADLDPDAKLLFLYMLTNRRSTAAGVFEITVRAMSFETGMDAKRVQAALKSISSRVIWWPEYQTVWVRNFLRHQAVSPNLYKSAWAEMLDMPGEIRDQVGSVYPVLVREEPIPDTKQELEALLIPIPKGSQRVPEPSRKTRLDKTSTSLEETSSLESGADAPVAPPDGTLRDIKGGRKTAPKAKPLPENGPAQQIVKAYCAAIGIERPVNYGKAVGQAKQLADAGITPLEIPQIVKWLQGQKWVDGAVDLGLVLNQADKWQAVKNKPAPIRRHVV